MAGQLDELWPCCVLEMASGDSTLLEWIEFPDSFEKDSENYYGFRRFNGSYDHIEIQKTYSPIDGVYITQLSYEDDQISSELITLSYYEDPKFNCLWWDHVKRSWSIVGHHDLLLTLPFNESDLIACKLVMSSMHGEGLQGLPI